MPTIADEKRLPSELDQKLRARRDAIVDRLRREHERSGLVLYDAEWMEPAAARRLHRRRMLGQGWQFIELALVAIVALLFAGVFLILLVGVSGARFDGGGGQGASPGDAQSSSSKTALIAGVSRSSN